MQFLIHGEIAAKPGTAALGRHSHRAVQPDAEQPSLPSTADTAGRAEFFALLAKNQWELITSDADLIHRLYDEKIHFNRTIVLLVANVTADPAEAIDRLFARYPRLSSRRLYTLTAGRVKIRQLPGAAGKLK